MAPQPDDLTVYIGSQGYFVAPMRLGQQALPQHTVSPFFQTQSEAHDWLTGVQAEMLSRIAQMDDDDLTREIAFADGFGPEAAGTAPLWIKLLHAEQDRRAEITPAAAKKVIAAALAERDLPFTKLTARTVDFTDLARARCVFVKIHGWQPNPAWTELRQIAVDNGFRIEEG